MVRRVVRVFEMPVSISLGVARKGASLAGRVVSRVLIGGRASEPPPPPAGSASASRPQPVRASATGEKAETRRPKPRRPAPAKSPRARQAHRRGPTATEAARPSERPPAPAAERAAPAAERAERPPAPEAAREPAETTSPERPASEPVATEPRGDEAPRVAAEPRGDGVHTGLPEGGKPGGGDEAGRTVPGEAEAETEVEHEPGQGSSVRAPSPHSPLNTPVGEPDPTEWPDPYDHREDPRDVPDDEGVFGGDGGHPPTGATSTSEPHPAQDPEAEPWEGPKRDRVDQ